MAVKRSGSFGTEGPPPLWSPRYKILDGWRALAALTVVCHHLQIGEKLNVGHIGVMVFFVISGYCIAGTSESSRRHGHGFATYMKRRIRRIYPPYFFAVCFFVVTRLMKWKMGMGMKLSSSIAAWVQTFTLTQWLSLIPHPVSYAAENQTLFVPAFWSLNYEEQFYLVIGGLMLLPVRFGRPILWGVLGLLVPAFAWNLTHPALSYGFFLEYWVHFSLGVLVFHRLCTFTSRAARRAMDIGLLILIITTGAVWIVHKGAPFVSERSVYAEWFITGTFALFLIASRPLDDAITRTWFGARLIKFGTLTYSLYLVHQFNLHVAYGTASLFSRIGVPHFFKVPIEILTMVIIATAFWYVCERPFINKPLDSGTKAQIDPPADATPSFVSA